MESSPAVEREAMLWLHAPVAHGYDDETRTVEGWRCAECSYDDRQPEWPCDYVRQVTGEIALNKWKQRYIENCWTEYQQLNPDAKIPTYPHEIERFQ